MIGDRQEVNIDDMTFYVQMYEPFKAIKVLGNLQKIILPVLKKTLAGMEDVDGILDKDLSSIKDFAQVMPLLEGLFGGLSENLDGDKLEKLMNMLLDSNYVSTKHPQTEKLVKLDKSVINQIFTGNLSAMFTLAFNVVKVNYADFFTTLSTRFGNLGVFTGKTTKSPVR